jgi:hypothetical protein
MTDELWRVMADTMARYRGIVCTDEHRKAVEAQAEIEEFDGGAWASVGNEIDLFVLPERQGKWRVRREVRRYLAKMHEKHPILIARINEANTRSLRLAHFFGFREVGREGTEIRLEHRL